MDKPRFKTQKLNEFTPENWTDSAIECYNRGCICENCDIGDLLSFKCELKKTVWKLLKTIGKPVRRY